MALGVRLLAFAKGLLSGGTTLVMGDVADGEFLQRSGDAIVGGTAGGGAPDAHASTHQNGGSDEVATATPGANAIPKARSSGRLAGAWLLSPTAKTADYTAVAGEMVLVDISAASGNVTITMPSPPTAGDMVAVGTITTHASRTVTVASASNVQKVDDTGFDTSAAFDCVRLFTTTWHYTSSGWMRF